MAAFGFRSIGHRNLGSFRGLTVRPLAILAVGAGKILYDSVALHHEYVVHRVIDEETVMTDHDKATLEFGKEFFKNTECDYIEIVRRFVKYEEIRLLHKHYGQMKAAALAAAEGVDILLLVGAAEKKALQVRDRGDAFSAAEHNFVGYFCHGVDHLF